MKDQISALVDDEVSLREAEYLYTALKAGGESRACWVTYHLIGDVMRQSPVYSVDLSARIMQRIADEPVSLAPRRLAADGAGTEHKLPLLWSVAASAAAVLFVGAIAMQQTGSEQPLQQQAAASEIAPVEIAQSLPAEYLQAHRAVAPSSAAYYIQPTTFSESTQ